MSILTQSFFLWYKNIYKQKTKPWLYVNSKICDSKSLQTTAYATLRSVALLFGSHNSGNNSAILLILSCTPSVVCIFGLSIMFWFYFFSFTSCCCNSNFLLVCRFFLAVPASGGLSFAVIFLRCSIRWIQQSHAQPYHLSRSTWILPSTWCSPHPPQTSA